MSNKIYISVYHITVLNILSVGTEDLKSSFSASSDTVSEFLRQFRIDWGYRVRDESLKSSSSSKWLENIPSNFFSTVVVGI